MLVKPQTPLHYYYLGNYYLEQGKFLNAEKSYLTSIKEGFKKAKIYNNLGITQKSMGKTDGAYKSFKQAIKLDPMLVEAYNNLGNIQIRLNHHEDAIKTFRKALIINPYYRDIYNNLGTIWHSLGETKKAIIYYKKAIEISSVYPDAYNNLGVAQQNLNYLKSAIKSFEKAISLRPNFAEAYFNLASIYHDLNDSEKVISYANHALSIFPDYPDALLLMVQHHEVLCNWEEVEKWLPQLDNMTSIAIKNNYRPGEVPFFNITNFDNPKRNFEVNRLWSESIKKIHPIKLDFKFKKRKEKKTLNIGYISSDFRDNVISHQFIDVFKYHNKNKFKIFTYSCGPNDRSYYRKVVEKNSSFRDIAKTDYLTAAKQIYKDKIDILIDLNGFTKGARLEISSLRPAPLEAHYLGFPGSVGDLFDYILTDKIVTPTHVARYYSEKFVYLPNCYQVQSYSRFEKNRKRNVSDKIKPSSFIFCSFNNNYKITKSIFSSWMNILKAVPNSILWLLKEHNQSQINLLNSAEKHGISKNRLIFTKRENLDSHLDRLSLADLALDTYPYSGGATTSNSLWAGVPVVTLQGKTYLARMSSSLLTAIGLPELITQNIKEYEKLVISLAKNPDKLKKIKIKLLKYRDSYPLFDTQVFVKNLEKAYIAMWQNYLDGKKPKILEIK